METDLRKAVLGNNLCLHYQPKPYLPSGEIIGMEALVRWPTSDGSQVYPDEFIPLAESTGLIIPMGRWILRQACMDTKMLNDRSFVRDLEYDSEDASIVSAVCSMARSLGLLVIAEGVETEGQLQFLKENCCDMAQGYHISRAVSIDAFEEYIQLHSDAENMQST